MTEEMIKKFSYDFCSDGTSCEYLLNYIKDGRPLNELRNSHWTTTLNVWLEVNSVTKEDVISWLESVVEQDKQINTKLAEVDKLLAQCEVIARNFNLTFSMPRVTGVDFGPTLYGWVGWNKSDYGC